MYNATSTDLDCLYEGELDLVICWPDRSVLLAQIVPALLYPASPQDLISLLPVVDSRHAVTTRH